MAKRDQVYERRFFPRDHVLARPGDPVRQLFLLSHGTVKTRTERLTRQANLGPGAVIGLADIIAGDPDPRFHVHAKTATEVEAIVLDAERTAREIAKLSPQMKMVLVALSRSIRQILVHSDAQARRREAAQRRTGAPAAAPPRPATPRAEWSLFLP